MLTENWYKAIFFRSLVILLLSVGLSGCSLLPLEATSREAPASGEVLFADDFSGSVKGWGAVENAGGEIVPAYDGLQFAVNKPNSLVWSVKGSNLADALVEVDVILLEGPVDDGFGVICRYVDENNFYAFLLSHDGYYGIFKFVEGQMIVASQDGSMSYSEAIRQGGPVNHIQAVCQGNRLVLSVNDTPLVEVMDESFSSGKVGLIAGTFEQAGVKVLFDNLEVYQP